MNKKTELSKLIVIFAQEHKVILEKAIKLIRDADGYIQSRDYNHIDLKTIYEKAEDLFSKNIGFNMI